MANKKALVIYNGIVKQIQSGDTVDPTGLSASAGLWTLNASNWIVASSNYPNVSIPVETAIASIFILSKRYSLCREDKFFESSTPPIKT